MPVSILWDLKRNRSSTALEDHQSQWIGPSWSWLSPTEPISIHVTGDKFEKTFATLISADITRLSEDPTGRIGAGLIKLKVFLIKIDCYSSGKESYVMMPEKLSIQCRLNRQPTEQSSADYYFVAVAKFLYGSGRGLR